MPSHNRNALIGLFVLGGLMALAALIIQFGEASWLFSTGYVVSAQYKTVAGVQEGTQVQLSGVLVGRVVDLELLDRENPSQGVVARMEIDRHYMIPQASQAVVMTPLMGQAIINIRPPLEQTPPVPTDGQAMIRGSVSNALESVIDPTFMAALEKTTVQIGELASAMKPAATAVKDILEQRTIRQVEGSTQPGEKEMTANLYTAVERLHRVLRHFDVVLGDPDVQSNVKLTLQNFREASEQVKSAAEGFRQFTGSLVRTGENVQDLTTKLGATVQTTHQHIDTLGKRLVENSDKLSKILDQITEVTGDLAEGQGAIPMLIRDPKFYDELMLTVKRLGMAATEMTVLVKQWQKDGLLGMR